MTEPAPTATSPDATAEQMRVTPARQGWSKKKKIGAGLLVLAVLCLIGWKAGPGILERMSGTETASANSDDDNKSDENDQPADGVAASNSLTTPKPEVASLSMDQETPNDSSGNEQPSKPSDQPAEEETPPADDAQQASKPEAGQPTRLAGDTDETLAELNADGQPPIRTLREQDGLRVTHLPQDAQDPDNNVFRRARSAVIIYRDRSGYNPKTNRIEIHYSFHGDLLEQHPEVINDRIRVRRGRAVWSTNLDHASDQPYELQEITATVDNNEVLFLMRGTHAESAPELTNQHFLGVYYGPDATP
jgi:hypothetical protein